MSTHLQEHFMEVPLLNTKDGYITLISVLVASTVAVSIAVTLLVIGVNASRTTAVLQATKYANTHAKSCIEEALSQVRNSSSFTGPGSIIMSQGSCDYNVTNTGGQSRLINATGIAQSAIRRLSITINSIIPIIGVSSWQEVADF